MRDMIRSIIFLIDAVSKILITAIVIIMTFIHYIRYGDLSTSLKFFVIFYIIFRIIRFCMKQAISIKSPRVFRIYDLLTSHNLVVRQYFFEEKDELAGFSELDLLLDDSDEEEPLLCAQMLVNRENERIVSLRCPAYKEDGERFISEVRTGLGLHDFWLINGFDGEENKLLLSCEHDMLQLLIRTIMSIKREDGEEGAREAESYMILNSEGCLPHTYLICSIFTPPTKDE